MEEGKVLLEKDGLTLSQRQFLHAYFENGLDHVKAAKAAKLHERAGYRLLARPDIQAQILEIKVGQIVGDCFPAAVDRLKKILTNDKAPAGPQVAAAKFVMGLVMPEAASTADKEPHEMTAEEVALEIDRLTRETAAKAKDVTPRGSVFD